MTDNFDEIKDQDNSEDLNNIFLPIISELLLKNGKINIG